MILVLLDDVRGTQEYRHRHGNGENKEKQRETNGFPNCIFAFSALAAMAVISTLGVAGAVRDTSVSSPQVLYYFTNMAIQSEIHDTTKKRHWMTSSV